jgi:hypothetical protein
MVNTNLMILGFMANNIVLILFSLLLLLPIIPPHWIGLQDTYFNTFYKKEMPVQKYSILKVLINSLLSPITEFLVIWSLKGTVSVVIFVVIGTDLLLRKQLSREAVALVSVGIIALYLEQLIEKAKKISIWKIIEWEKEDDNN